MPCGVEEWPSGTGAESDALAEAVAVAGAGAAAAGFEGADAETAEVLADDAGGAGLRAAITTLPAAADGFAGEAAAAAAGFSTTRAPALAAAGMALVDTPVGAAALLVGVDAATGLDTSALWPLPPARILMTPPLLLLLLALLTGALPAAVAAAGRLAMMDSCECVE